MKAIQIENITKDYGNGRGVFNVSFAIERGEVFGFLGPNGAGKTTTIRQMLGFIRPDSGRVLIEGKNVAGKYYETNAHIGYLPGEISFPDGMRGMEFLRWCAELRGMHDLGRASRLIELLKLKNADSDVKRMSKGMKQKIGIVCAFMHDPDILIPDEPTSGLDPLMQEAFIGLIRDEKKRGKTVLMSSHMFPEIEKTCDRTAIIRNGKIAAVVDMADIQKSSRKEYKIKFRTQADCCRFAKESFAFSEVNPEKTRVRVKIDDAEINRLIRTLAGFDIRYISEVKQTLEDCFMRFYDSGAGSEPDKAQ
ncbi:MAG: ABC transporter ATP-binding protein [Clostridiales bacterium]|nr:ABC transporter ATP-binding protein [Clostridiales bacterium]